MLDYINNFSTTGGVVNISNLQSGCAGGGYSDLTQTDQLHVNQGDTFGIAVQSGINYSQGFRIWIDWNQDGHFAHPDESVWDSGVPGFQVFNGTITVPPHAMPGVTRMRVRSDFNKPPVNPCDWQYYGETEDYALVVLPFHSADAGADKIVSPLPMDYTGLKQIEVKFTNYGSDTLTSVLINWSINGQLQPPFQWNGTLPTNGTVTAQTIGTYQFPVGFYEIKTWTSSPNNQVDSFPLNDTVTGMFYFHTALGGTYTIGGLGADFEDITTAVTTLHFYGVNAPVVFSFDSLYGPYTGGHELVSISGSSATNTITFQGNGSVIKEGSKSYILAINGLSFFTLNGFTIVNTSQSTPRFCVAIRGGSQHINITNNRIDAGIAHQTEASGGIIMSDSYTAPLEMGTNGHHIHILNNHIVGGFFGVALSGGVAGIYVPSISNQINNNTIQSFFRAGIYLGFCYGAIVEGNDISSPKKPSYIEFHGIRTYYAQYTRIYNNRIHSGGALINAGYGIRIEYSDNTVGFETEIINNVIYDFPRSIYGISLSGGPLNRINIYHNTVAMGHKEPVHTTRAVSISSTNNHINVFNNNLSITSVGGGTGHCLALLTPSTTFQSNHNNFHVSFSGGGNGYVGRLGSNNMIGLLQWQIASVQDSWSFTFNPGFSNAAHGDLTPLSVPLDNMGLHKGVYVDFYGNPRSLNNPDIGAIEFTGYATDLAVVGGRLTSGVCPGASDSVYVSVSLIAGLSVNFSQQPQTVHWISRGPVTSSGTIAINSGSISTGGVLTLGSSGIDLSQPGEYTLDVWLSASPFNLYAGNDTLRAIHTYTVRPAIVFSTGKTVERTDPNDSVALTVYSHLFPSSDFFFSEISMRRGELGKPAGGWPYWLRASLYLEITGVPHSDLGGLSLELWGLNQLSWAGEFPSRTVLSHEGVAVIGYGPNLTPSVTRPEYNYYHLYTYYMNPSTNTSLGWVLRDTSGAVVDAVAYGNYVFPASSGVTPSHWQGFTPLMGQNSAGMALMGPYTRDSSNWVDAGATGSSIAMTPHQLNDGVELPAMKPLPGLVWSHNGVNTSLHNMDTVLGPWSAPGIYRYHVTYNSSCGIITDSVTIIIKPSGVNYSGDTTICSGDSLKLQITLPGTAPFTLLLSDGSTTDTVSGIPSSPYEFYVQPTATTTYTYIGFSDHTSPLQPLNLHTTVTVTPLPVITFTSSLSFCEGTTGQLTGAMPAGGSWSGNFIIPGNLPSFQADVAGVGIHQVYYSYTSPTTECSNTGALDVNVLPAPQVNPGPDQVICETAVATLSVNTGLQHYQWSTGDSTHTIVVTGATIGAGNTATFTVTVTDSYGCEATDSIKVSVIDCTGIATAEEKSGITLFPNPSTGMFVLTVRGIEGDGLLEIFSMKGEKVHSQALHLHPGSAHTIHPGHLGSGIWLLRLTTDHQIHTKTLIINQ